MSINKKIGLYIHIPFCLSKCPYCDFFSIVSHDDELKERYVSALINEIEIYGRKIKDMELISIYVGGGTPTVLEGEQLKEILSSCFYNFSVAEKAEITIEVNPGTIDGDKIKTIFRAGVNRISIGGQSFNDRVLKKIGRIHSKEDIMKTYQLARYAGFNNINVDLMFGLPGLSKREFEKTLKELMMLRPEHISLYALTIEQGTPFYEFIESGKARLPSDDFCSKLFVSAIDLFSGNGYEHYEISNFALTGKRCIHNELYWKNESYLGIGAGATSYLDNKRYQNYRDLNQYINLLESGILPIRYQEILPLKERMAETIILKLRMMEGLNKDDFRKKFKVPVEKVFYTPLQTLQEQGLLADNGSNYLLTKKGILLANNVFTEFLD
ncbi:MAG: radical SAM family heme chaperone HemW [Atribacterota bacterium]|nr:radical SAM family heme chaperone HemW [Atribacterota bacterium]